MANLGPSAFDGGIKKDQDTYGHFDSLPSIELMGYHVKNHFWSPFKNILSSIQKGSLCLCLGTLFNHGSFKCRGSGYLKAQLFYSFIHQPRRKRSGQGVVLLEFWASLYMFVFKGCCVCSLELSVLLLCILIVYLGWGILWLFWVFQITVVFLYTQRWVLIAVLKTLIDECYELPLEAHSKVSGQNAMQSPNDRKNFPFRKL